MKTIELENIKYDVIEDNDNVLNIDELKNKYTDYFYEYDYVLGDYSYGKLRLKGFCDKNNKKWNKINDISTKDIYIKEECAYKCKYFMLKRVKNY